MILVDLVYKTTIQCRDHFNNLFSHLFQVQLLKHKIFRKKLVKWMIKLLKI